MRNGHPRRFVGIVSMIGVPSPVLWPSRWARAASKRAAMKIGLRFA